MSHVPLERTQNTCPAYAKLLERDVALGSLAFLEQVYRMQANEAYEELGDILVNSDQDVLNAQELAGTTLDLITARQLFNAVNTCLSQRYTGTCSTSGNCSGREFIDEKLEVLEITRYRAETV